jgi:hypothetical protein
MASRCDLFRAKGNEFYLPLLIDYADHFCAVAQPFINDCLPLTQPEDLARPTLSESLDGVHSSGVPHGDLNLKNVLIEPSSNVAVFDWEPALVYRQGPCVHIRSCAYSLHPLDAKLRTITVRSDRFALACMSILLRNGRNCIGSLAWDEVLRLRVAEMVDLRHQCSLQRYISSLIDDPILPSLPKP